jgi:DHA3 family tetracycline resistance protein-like MFS transporter
VVWIGLLRAAGLLLSTGAAEIVARSVDTARAKALVRALFLFSLLLVGGMFTFALAGAFWLAIAAYLLIDVTRDLIGPVYTAWVNQRLDSHVRATVISMSGQVDAIGQIAGGPFMGVIGSTVSVRAALLTSSLILTPVLALYRMAVKGGEQIDVTGEGAAEPDDQIQASDAS